MRRLLAIVLLTVTSSVVAQQTPPSQLLSAKEIRDISDKLLKTAKAAPTGLAFRDVVVRTNGKEQVTVRVKTGQGEWHHDDTDVLIGLSGHAEVITGGSVVNGKQTAPGEIRGDGVQGGTKQPFGPGDVIRIEPQTAHQFVLPAGGEVRYLSLKIPANK